MMVEEIPKAVIRNKKNYGSGKSANIVEYEFNNERYITGTIVRGTDKSLGWYFGKGSDGLREANRIALLSDEEFAAIENNPSHSWVKVKESLTKSAKAPSGNTAQNVPEMTTYQGDKVKVGDLVNFGAFGDRGILVTASPTEAMVRPVKIDSNGKLIGFKEQVAVKNTVRKTSLNWKPDKNEVAVLSATQSEILKDYSPSAQPTPPTNDPRSPHAIAIDNALLAKKVTTSTDIWAKSRNSMDLRGIDTPKLRIVKSTSNIKLRKIKTTPKPNGLHSKKEGRIFRTQVGRGSVLSRRPLGRRI